MFKCVKQFVLSLVLVLTLCAVSFAGVTIQGDIPAKRAEGAYDISTFIDDASSGKIYVIDVRTPEEYAAGHISGSKNISIATDLEKELPNLPTDKPVVFMCAKGKRASTAYYMVADKLPEILQNVFFLDAAMEYKDNGDTAIILPNLAQ